MMGRSRVIGNGGFLMATATPAPLPGSLTLIVEGMSCASCVKRVEAVAARVPGVAESSVNLASEKLTVRTREGFSPTALAKAVRKAGYGVAARRLEVAVEGMTCASCVRRVATAVAQARKSGV